MKKVLITESQLKAMVRKMLMEQTAMSTVVGQTGFEQTQPTQQKDQPIETAMLSALQRDTALLGKIQTASNFNQVDKLIQTLLSLTKIPQAQIKTGLASLSRMDIQSQAGK